MGSWTHILNIHLCLLELLVMHCASIHSTSHIVEVPDTGPQALPSLYVNYETGVPLKRLTFLHPQELCIFLWSIKGVLLSTLIVDIDVLAHRSSLSTASWPVLSMGIHALTHTS